MIRQSPSLIFGSTSFRINPSNVTASTAPYMLTDATTFSQLIALIIEIFLPLFCGFLPLALWPIKALA